MYCDRSGVVSRFEADMVLLNSPKRKYVRVRISLKALYYVLAE